MKESVYGTTSKKCFKIIITMLNLTKHNFVGKGEARKDATGSSNEPNSQILWREIKKMSAIANLSTSNVIPLLNYIKQE